MNGEFLLWGFGAFCVFVLILLIGRCFSRPSLNIDRADPPPVRKPEPYRYVQDRPDYGRNYPAQNERPVLPHTQRYGRRPRQIADPVILTPRMLERANIRRQAAGAPPLTRDGFKQAVALSSVQHRNSDDWIIYFIAYQCMIEDHEASSSHVDQGITVQPDEPGGGQFGGAGASSSWDPQDPAPVAASRVGVGALAVAAGVIGVALAPDEAPAEPSAPADDHGDDKYAPGDTVGGYSAPEPESQSDPQPDPPAADTSSSE